VAGLVHVQPAGHARADEAGGLRLPVPPAVYGLRARAVLRERAVAGDDLALGALAVGVAADREEEVVVALWRAVEVGKVGGEQQPQLGQDRAAQREQPLLLALAADAERAALGVEVADLDAGEFGASQAKLEQAEQPEPVAGVLSGQQETRAGVEGEQAGDLALGAGAADASGGGDGDVSLFLT
jgi:hypothetical protein